MGLAEARFRELYRRAEGPRDRVQAALRLGDVLAQWGRLEEAVEQYVVAYADAVDDEDHATASLRVALLALRHDSPREGVEAIWSVIRRFPQTVAALRALDALGELYRALDAAAGAGQQGAELRVYGAAAQASGLKVTRVGFHAALRAARLLRARGRDGDRAAALAYLAPVLDHRPHAALWDDAQFERVLLLLDDGRPEDACRAIDDILSLREQPRLFGNYETKFYHRGQLLKARIARDVLRDLPRAELALSEFVREFPFARTWDDALFEWAEVLRLLGRPQEARGALEVLLRERPESKYAERAQVILDRGTDPGPPGPWAPVAPASGGPP